MTQPFEIIAAAGEPTLSGTGLTLRAVIKAAYDGDAAIAAALTDPPLSRETLDAAVNFCAGRACDDMGVYCKGCRLRQSHEGVLTLDDYCNQYERIVLDDTGNRFRHDAALWPHALQTPGTSGEQGEAVTPPPLILYKLHRPLPSSSQPDADSPHSG